MKMQKKKSETTRTVYYSPKVKCAMTSCGIEFRKSEGVKGVDGELYCSGAHAEIERIIRGKR